ncbi:AAA family ATPase [Corynebacterium sp. P5848]|uniref:AAA family ATPase n=1 Tax=Corynebacterium marambiense TaxID=2765364 RepID=UPI002260DA6A|nr:AAA family ATPase [Corynebacterium marambiense]MCX7543328.1 AAA family ATPase [Corynebacterium marambiense]
MKDLQTIEMTRDGERFQYDFFTSKNKKGDSINTRVALIYGRNGSGKSTLARCMRTTRDVDFNLRYITESGRDLDPTSFQVRVFDEAYIEDNVRVKKSGLGNIVLFGEQVDVDIEIANNRSIMEKNEKIIKENISTQKEYKKEKDELYRKIQEQLRQDSGWAGRESRLSLPATGRKRVTERVIQTVFEASKDAHSAMSATELVERIDAFLDLKSGEKTDLVEIQSLSSSSGEEIKNLLNYSVSSKNDGNNIVRGRIRDNRLGIEELQSIFSDVCSGDVTVCPKCFQDLPESHKEILSRAIREELERIKKSGIKDLSNNIDFQCKIRYPDSVANRKLDELSDLVRETCQSIKSEFFRLEELISQKIDNPDRDDLELGEWILDKLFRELKERVEEYNAAAIDYNKKIEAVHKEKEYLSLENIKTSYAEVETFISQMRGLEKKIDNCAATIEFADDLLSECGRKIEQLTSRSENVEIAVSEINRYLSEIFADHDRMRLSYRGGNYSVSVRGQEVSPEFLSTGERNVLALCYFFVESCEQLEESSLFSRATLYLIDDPLTSFDSDNKFGVFCFTYSVFRRILKGSKESKLILLSHDFSFIEDLGSSLRNENFSTAVGSFDGGRLIPEFPGYGLVYHDLFLACCETGFVNSGLHGGNFSGSRSRPTITGNGLRRLLEAFAKFELNESVTTFVHKDFDIIGSWSDSQRLKEYFQTRMFRILVHPESHSGDQVQSGNMVLIPTLHPEEFQHVCRDALAFFYLVSPNHVMAQFGKKKWRQYEPILKKYIEDIDRSPSR